MHGPACIQYSSEHPFLVGVSAVLGVSFQCACWQISEAESKEKDTVLLWDPMPQLTITSNTFTMGNPMPESTLTLCRSRTPPVRDLGFGFCIEDVGI